jgi:hypothetical protein
MIVPIAIPDIDVVDDELVRCVVNASVVDDGIGVGRHVRSENNWSCTRAAQLSNPVGVDVNSRHKSLECG